MNMSLELQGMARFARNRGFSMRSSRATVLQKNKFQRGQSTFEYLSVTSCCIMVLLARDSNGDVLIVQLANALKGFYNAFAFALSFSSTITPL